MKLITALDNALGHTTGEWTSAERRENSLVKMCQKYDLDPYEEINQGDKVHIGAISFIAFDVNNSTSLLKERPSETISCPTCAGTGEIKNPSRLPLK